MHKLKRKKEYETDRRSLKTKIGNKRRECYNKSTFKMNISFKLTTWKRMEKKLRKKIINTCVNNTCVNPIAIEFVYTNWSKNYIKKEELI